MTTDFFEFKNGLNPDVKRFGTGIKFISVMDILNNRYITYDKIISAVEAKDDDLRDFGVNYGDILFQRSSETLEDVGRANVYLDEKPALFGGFVIRGKRIGDYNPLFFRYLLSSPSVRKRIIVKGAGAQHFNIGQDGLSKVSLFVPSAKEQDRIAQLLNAIDKRIEVQSGLIEKLESLISGITLIISKSDDCEFIRLSEILTERNEVNTAQYEVYSVSVSQGVVNQVDYLGRSFAAKDTSNYNVVHYGDIVYTKSPTGEFPYGIVKRSGQTDPVAVSPLYGVYKPASNEIGCFLHYYFCNPVSAKNYLHKLIQKGAKNTINITNQRFLENTIKVPKAEKLTIVVKLLNQISAKKQHAEELLTYYRKQKRYFLSQMFI
jgi:type I restriction enzyme S subunit